MAAPLAVVAGLLGAGFSWACAPSAPPNIVPLLKTDAWRNPGKLFLRRAEPPLDGLLLRLDTSPVVCLYKVSSHTLEGASEEVWRSASTPVADCESQSDPDPRLLRIDSKSRNLVAGTRIVGTAGETAIAARLSPSGDRIAVLSAEGPPTPSVFPSLTSGGSTGRHYHQTLNASTLQPISSAIELPFKTDRGVYLPCWSVDDDFVVYSDRSLYALAVVDVKVVK